MRPSLIFVFAIVLSCSYSLVNAQVPGLFSPFDCRLHAEEVDQVAMAKTQALEEDSLVQAIINSITNIDLEPLISVDTLDGWKEWSYVENYNFGKDRGALPMITDLEALHPYFRDQILELVNNCRKKGIELAIVETYRTHAKQHEYKTMGKKYTSSGAGRSKHQYGLAIDVVPIVDSVAVWDNVSLWRKIGTAGEKLGLRWGGRWRKPYDPGHFEWTGGASTSGLGAGSFPRVPFGEKYYPCLDEDLRLLRRYWSEWETSQSSLTRK